MKRTLWAMVAGIFAVGAMVGCGNLKKDEFLPEYQAYKAENEDRFSALSSADAKTASDISALQNADKMHETAIEDAKNDAIAASEQGDADTLEAAMKADKTLRMELDEAIAAGKKAAMASADRADKAMKKEVDAALAKSAKSVMAQLNEMQAKSASNMKAFRAETAEMLHKAIPTKVSTVYFSTGSTRLSAKAKSMLDAAAAAVKKRPSATVVVTGHADSTPILSGAFLTNLQLSEARANSAAKYLRSKGVSNKLVVRGRGHFETAGTQSSSEGRAASRRVEIIMVAE